MVKIWAICRKELTSYLLSPLFFVLTAIFLLISGYFFSAILLINRIAEMRVFLGNMAIVFLLLAPVFTMRLLAEEVQNGTEELLLTSPVSVTQVVLGKYLAILILFILLLVLSGVYPLILNSVGEPDMGPILSGYLGFFLMGAAFLAVGVFTSSLSNSQMVAGVLGFGILLIFWVFSWLSGTSLGILSDLAGYLSLWEHFADFTKGIVDIKHVVFYLSIVAAFLFLAVQNISRRIGA
ncbi:ABC transporter permease [Calderihabitans maritimus]|uniref:ABC transporter n=1 Tax=Calderihabitans maritimus TaxID=1246530 RepID=A0A1Z5HNY0_9FIRM|nr:ABC transporter permease subunit [Calderihabitans maritimus]GAW90980.1 ABC transporter [Calderihabitans maritimus]